MAHPTDIAFKLEDEKKNNIVHITHENLNRSVFLPHADLIIQSIIDAYKKLKGDRRLILSGDYAQDPYFITHLVYDSHETFLKRLDLVKNLFDSVSSGTVSSALRKSQTQIPFFRDHSEKVVDDYYADRRKNNNEEDYDFVVGLGKSSF